ncbi:hypothetical protein PSTAB_1071 [Stutzerimonas stutzeri]|uniref:Uncharacterized protein n=1 Tax=Stutzerimonas stutzeri (strain ATCC 17588 / DSM 5190 / CCUG 11256 / JCM 5965 / LMG 11199 / NBRC 14165 / NCIMB 11358 / Stanier 221) TaxID=96563 RepID=F8H154_STUS2|nr:hypothetical protein PSTAB_1071 [Stutzerimonas stutzeri]
MDAQHTPRTTPDDGVNQLVIGRPQARINWQRATDSHGLSAMVR